MTAFSFLGERSILNLCQIISLAINTCVWVELISALMFWQDGVHVKRGMSGCGTRGSIMYLCVREGEATHPSSHLNKPERRSIPRWASQQGASGFTSISFSLTRAKSQDPLAHLPDSLCVNVCMTIAGLAASLLSHKDLHSLFWAWERKYTCNSTRTLKVTRSVKPLHFCSGSLPLPWA